ncbi:alpha-2C adrenergic receptor-like [Paroedura picta]|uniref:alpha-2C adrenergic receptor-like n=1 Tax=Paroedura picta TaxID=143630 RepID=UPI0040566E20
MEASAAGNGSAASGGPYSAAAAAGLAAAGSLLIATTLGGNALVVAAVARGRALRGPQHLFVASLAGADLLLAVLVMPFSLAHELHGGWPLGRAWCRAYLALDVLLCTASIAHLCAISLHRYCALAAPDGPRRRPVKAALAAAWLLAAAVACPPLLAHDDGDDDDTGGPGGCRLNERPWYIVASSVASFFAPALLMGLVYARLHRRAQAQRRPHAPLAAARRARREQRLGAVLAAVMGAFVLCWAPFFVTYSVWGVCREACRPPEPLFKAFFWLGYCNSALNPLLYAAFHRDFRRAFRYLLCGRRALRQAKPRAGGGAQAGLLDGAGGHGRPP